MYKTIIVDDEPVIVRNMQKVIDWTAYGFRICATATSAIEACDLLEEHQPDLVITDVMMPEMNGIELAHYIRGNFPKIEVVVVSGYDEFDYAQSAMRAGVMEYLTKPTQKEELEAALRKVGRRIADKADAQRNVSRLKEAVRQNYPILKNQLFNDLMNRLMKDEEEIRKKLKSYESSLKGKSFILCCADLDQNSHFMNYDGYIELLWMQMKIIFAEKLNSRYQTEQYVCGGRLYYIIEADQIRQQEKDILVLLGEIIAEFKNLTGMSASVGISKPYEAYSYIYRAARECEIALEERCRLGEGSCILYEEINLLNDNGLEYNHSLMDNICVKIRALNEKEGQVLICQMYDDLREQGAIYQQFYSQSILILIELYNIASEGDEVLREELRQAFAALAELKTGEQLKAYIQELAVSVIQKVSLNNVGKNKVVIDEIMHYIEAHISEEIALGDVADAVHMSKNYLCSLFKKEQGETIFDYITRTRIERAKTLLRKTDHKVYVIAEMAGYTDYAYFAQVFKKIVGVSAGEYRIIYGD